MAGIGPETTTLPWQVGQCAPLRSPGPAFPDRGRRSRNVDAVVCFNTCALALDAMPAAKQPLCDGARPASAAEPASPIDSSSPRGPAITTARNGERHAIETQDQTSTESHSGTPFPGSRPAPIKRACTRLDRSNRSVERDLGPADDCCARRQHGLFIHPIRSAQAGLVLRRNLINRRRRSQLRRRSAAQALPDEHVDRVFHELNVAVGHQGIDAAGVLAAGGDVQRQPAPQRVGPCAVRQAAAAVGLLVIGRPKVVIETVARCSVMPAHALGCLELGRRRRQAQAKRLRSRRRS